MNYFLIGKNVGLRKLLVQDINGSYKEWLNDSEVCKYNSHGRFPVSPEQLQEYIEANSLGNSNLILAIIDLSTEKHIGNISLQNINYIDRNAEIAYLLGDKEYWGKGRARESSELLIYHGFFQLNLERIYCGTSEENKPMICLAERLGFMQEGIRRNAIYNNGTYHNIIEYGLLKSEYHMEKHTCIRQLSSAQET